MRNLILVLLFIASTSISAQNDSIQKERYKIINAIHKNLDVEKYGKAELDKNFFIFLGLSAIINDRDLIENSYGHCADYDNEIEYSYSEIITQEDIENMHQQISLMAYYKTIDSTLISDKIKLSKENNNSKTAISLPLIHKNKAIVYRTNRNNQEDLFVLVKEDGEWIIRCIKNLYLRFDD